MVGAVVLVVMVIAGCILAISVYIVAIHRARAAADLVALSGAAAQAEGQDACRAARRLASANGVGLVTCDVRGDSLDFVVSVTVALEVPAPVPLLPRQVEAAAHAGRLGLLR